jgi:hypothetical protein
LIDFALAPELGLGGNDREAVGGIAAIAATLADIGIDNDAQVRIFEQAAFASTALFGRAHLIVNNG